MHLNKITLRDFGAYRGEQSLNLTTEKGRPIVLIGGLNGCGKTTLLDAIQLALYGRRARLSGRGAGSYDNYLQESINRLADPAAGASVVVEFSITDLDGQKRRYKVDRNWKVVASKLRESLQVYVDDTISGALSEGWADHVEDLLPLEVASLFFFDGEKIESLADPESSAAVIEAAVRSLLGVDQVEQLRTDLVVLQRRERAEESDHVALDTIQGLETELAAAQQAVEATQQTTASLRARLGRAAEVLERAQKEFEKDGGAVYERHASLKAQQEQLQKIVVSTDETLRASLAAGPLPLVLVRDLLGSVLDHAHRERTAAQSAEVVSTLENRDQWLMDLMQKSLSKSAAAEIAEQLQLDRKRRSGDAQAPRLLDLPHDMLLQLNALDQALEHDRVRAVELVEQATEKSAELDTVDRLLASTTADDKSIEALMKARDQALRQVVTLETELARAAESNQDAKNHRKSLTAKLDRANRTLAKQVHAAKEAQRLVDYVDRTRITLSKYASALLNRHINRLEVAVLDSFNRLMHKSGLVANLNIDTEKFKMNLIRSDGEPLDPARLSAGERQLLAVSLLWGVARVAGNQLPSVIDTPLGRLDSNHRENLVERYFPHASEQVLLLSTDEEIDERLYKRLKGSIAHAYTLDHDKSTLTTSVHEGYWWTTGATHVA
ncbi:DNA sulfur modification protein DndD [Streptomyces sp. ADMS]|uniref:DNA sulfur modification protein DndD n=1 Tax=Streptomyces sp. ADMS TaxID=3071415 RepID=UPI00296F2C8E|nr:DNA sulfur modification protein DndD [Streptomyces sp. ADMS]MDW4909421.1 DNA sulfur modification protein DndD [Streptomyces sp. ADMS]